MPAREIMKKFRQHTLHSGRSGKIVRNKKQAKAILLSYLRKEGRIGPRKGKKTKRLAHKRVVSKQRSRR
jgi:hypothetical protein